MEVTFLNRVTFPERWAGLDKRAIGVFAKLFISAMSLLLAEYFIELDAKSALWTLAMLVTVRVGVSFLLFGEYSLSWTRASSKTGFLQVILGAASLAIYLPIFLWLGEPSLAFVALEWVFFQYIYNTAIFGYRHVVLFRTSANRTAIIYGSHLRGVRLAQELQRGGYKVLCFIDDSSHDHLMNIDGIPITSLKQTISKIRDREPVDMLIFAMEESTPATIDRRWKRLQQYFKTCKILPSIEENLRERSYLNLLKPITIEDLLARQPKDLDRTRINAFLRNRTILITGAGGSIGSELARQCSAAGVRELLLLDHSEFNLYQICEELPEAIPLMVSVTNYPALEAVFQQYRPEIVIHAAAYKHVPLVEMNPISGIRNNVLGTKNTIDLSIEYKAKKFVLISTDKAVRPTNVMGATKRVCELYAQNSNGQGTDIVAVRFGNVLGSSGSVIPKFRKLIEEGCDLPVTHPDITRYFMLIPEACALVLQAGAMGHGGELFILDMGDPVRIADLAQRMLDLSGRFDLKVVYTGLRPGEKLYEELLINDADLKTAYRSIMVARPTKMAIGELQEGIHRLLVSDDPIEGLKTLVPEFEHQRDNKVLC